MQSALPPTEKPASALRGELELLDAGEGFLVRVHRDGLGRATELRVGARFDSESRSAFIAELRAGKHAELELTAITFKQRDGSPNRNYLRFKTDKLAAIAASFVGMPVLLDHNRWAQDARVGTITASEAVELAHGWTGFRQTLRVVKPHAVISVLDGTLDRFSIGWSTTGAVLCSVHKTDKLSRGRCSCWPGDKVEVDGKAAIVEYEWQSAEGIETSGVNVPAVKGTKIEDVRAALAAELNIAATEQPAMFQFPRLAAVLGLAALSESDEDRAVAAVDVMRRELAATKQELAISAATIAEQTATIATLRKAEAISQAARVDTAIDAAYTDGRLLYGKDAAGANTPDPQEAFLREVARDHGLDKLAAFIARMPKIAKTRVQVLTEGEPPRPGGPIDASVLASTAKQLGLKPEELAEHANTIGLNR